MIENTYGLKFGEYADHQTLERCVHELEKKHKCLSVGSIGSTILGRTIPEITIGSGDRCVLYIGAHHGMEWITSALLLLLAAELADAYESGPHRLWRLGKSRAEAPQDMYSPDAEPRRSRICDSRT